MSYSRRVLKRRTATLTDEEWAKIVAAGRLPRPAFALTPPGESVAVKDRKVLCWWCREVHFASEVLSCMALPMRRAANGSSTSSTSSVLVAGLLTQYSEIWEFLTATKYPDGKSRRTGRLSLSCESGGIRCSLMDDETGQYASQISPSLDDLLLSVEAALADGSLSWRESKYSKPGKR